MSDSVVCTLVYVYRYTQRSGYRWGIYFIYHFATVLLERDWRGSRLRGETDTGAERIRENVRPMLEEARWSVLPNCTCVS